MAEKRMIDADTLLETIHDTADGLADCDQQNAAWALRKYAVRDIMGAPTVDAVEVVRCSSCQHSTLPAVLTQRYGEPGTLTCHNWKSPCNKRNVKADDFCSYGDRKEGDGNG